MILSNQMREQRGIPDHWCRNKNNLW